MDRGKSDGIKWRENIKIILFFSKYIDTAPSKIILFVDMCIRLVRRTILSSFGSTDEI